MCGSRAATPCGLAAPVPRIDPLGARQGTLRLFLEQKQPVAQSLIAVAAIIFIANLLIAVRADIAEMCLIPVNPHPAGDAKMLA